MTARGLAKPLARNIASGINSYGASGGSFDPSQLAGLELWLDASDTSTVLNSISPDTPATDGQTVRRWLDKSGNDLHANQATGVNQPLFDADGLNGNGVLTFDGSNDKFTVGTTSTFNFLHDGTEHLVCAVVKFGIVSDPNTLYAILGSTASALSSVGVDVRYDDRSSASFNDAVAHIVRSGAPGNAVSNFSANNFFAANEFGILTILADPSNTTAADRSKIAKNAGAFEANNFSTVLPDLGDASRVLEIGSSGNGVFPMRGQLAELIIASGADATESNRQQLLGYLNAKWLV